MLTIVPSENNTRKEIQRRIILTWTKYRSLREIIKKKQLKEMELFEKKVLQYLVEVVV